MFIGYDYKLVELEFKLPCLKVLCKMNRSRLNCLDFDPVGLICEVTSRSESCWLALRWSGILLHSLISYSIYLFYILCWHSYAVYVYHFSPPVL